MELTQKERSLLKDLKEQEQLCVDKYTKHSSSAKDAQLKNLFSNLAQCEQKHYDTLTQIENGTVPTLNGASKPQPTFSATYNGVETEDKKADCYLCTDVLAGEKHASHMYDVSVFEFKDEKLRTALDTIQNQEHEHGKMIYDYMAANGMYS